MRRWFLSYNSQDLALIQAFEAALRRKDTEAHIFFASRSLRAGGYWLPELAKEIAEATAFVLLVGEKGLGPWQVTEYYEALDRRVKEANFPIVLVLLDGQSAPGLPFLRQLHWIITPDPASEKCLATVIDATAGGGGLPSDLWRHTAPYRGLAAMTEADSDFFFGRGRETVDVLSALASTADRLPVLIGNSGVGKSSLAQAGVLAALKRQAWPEEAGAPNAWPQAFENSRQWCFLTLKPGTTDILLAASDRPYGANFFYGPYDSWERTKGWFASIQQQLGQRTAASFGYRRHSDLFVLFADQPQIYENNHITTSYEGALRRADTLTPNTTLSYGVEADGDTIHSNSLGQHARNQGAGYANLSLRALRRFSLSVGARDEILTGDANANTNVFSPSVAGAYTLTHTVRLRASASHGFRLPTYVDLYYSDPTTIGNPNLKPESSWSYEAGLDWAPDNGRLTLTSTAFRLQQKNSIDYSKQTLATPALTFAEPYQAVNIQNLNITGAESTLRLRLSSSQQLQFSYAAAHAASPPPNLISEYAYNYATQNAIFTWIATLPGSIAHQITAYTGVNIVQRTQQTAYPLWDITLARNTGRLRPYFRLLNLSNTGYQEIPQVPMQGRTLIAGTEFNWSRNGN